jgi:hypothetical protein
MSRQDTVSSSGSVEEVHLEQYVKNNDHGSILKRLATTQLGKTHGGLVWWGPSPPPLRRNVGPPQKGSQRDAIGCDTYNK